MISHFAHLCAVNTTLQVEKKCEHTLNKLLLLSGNVRSLKSLEGNNGGVLFFCNYVIIYCQKCEMRFFCCSFLV